MNIEQIYKDVYNQEESPKNEDFVWNLDKFFAESSESDSIPEINIEFGELIDTELALSQVLS